MQLINPYYPWKKNEVKLKVYSKKLPLKCIFYPIANDPDANYVVKMQQKLLSWILIPFVIIEWIWFL